MAESILLSEQDVVYVCRKDIRENIAWLKTSTDDQKKLLRDYLLHLDASNRIDFNRARSQDICKGVNEIMTKICTNMKERDPRFTCSLVPMGSVNNQTKIDDLNELDFVCELITSNLLEGKGTVSVDSDTDDIDVHFANGADCDLCKPFILPLYDSSGNTNPQKAKLDFHGICRRFYDILESVLQELELPPGWCHGGFNRPTCSGWRENGVARLLQFDYLGTCEYAPVRLSVDFVPMIRIPISRDPDLTSLDRSCIDLTGVKHGWLSPESEELYYSNAEELLLAKYSSASMPKAVMRIGKVLGRLLKMNCKQFVGKVNSTFESLDNESTIWQETAPLNMFLDAFDAHDSHEYVTYSDLGEIIGDHCLLKSYTIKRTVMSMMMASGTHGHNWTEDDLPDLVICLYRYFVDGIDDDHFQSKLNDDFYIECRLSVPLGDNSDNNKDLNSSVNVETVKHSADFKVDETITYLKTSDEDYRNDLRSEPLLLTRLSAIFQLLRSVCEGLTTAEIVTRREVVSRYYMDRLVTKEEYQGKAIVFHNELRLAISKKMD